MAIDISKAPDVLSEGAKSLYVSAFNSAQVSSDAEKANAAWLAVKAKYQKNDGGDWVEKSFSEINVEVEGVPLPGSLTESPFSAGMTWIAAFQERYENTRDLAEASSFAWNRLKAAFVQDATSGFWMPKPVDPVIVSRPFGHWETFDDCVAEIMDKNPEYDEETAKATCGKIKAETESKSLAAEQERTAREAELDVEMRTYEAKRLPVPYSFNGGAVIVDGLTEAQEAVLLMRGMGKYQAVCPEGMSEQEWIARPAGLRTVDRVLSDKRRSRGYKKAVNRFVENHGFKARANPSNNGEMILSGPTQYGDQQPSYLSGVLTHKSELTGFEPDHWEFRPLSRGDFRGSLTALRVPANEMRFRGPVLK